MKKNYKNNNEIDLEKLLKILFLKKKKLFFIIASLTIITFGYLNIKPKTNFIASTLVDPIDTSLSDEYTLFNSIELFEITPEILINLYLDELKKKEIIEDSIKQSKLYDKGNFKNEEEYFKAIKKLSYSLNIKQYKKIIDKKLKESLNENSWVIEGYYNDENKWIKFIEILDENINNKINKNIVSIYQNKLDLEKNRKKFKLEDIDLQLKILNLNYEKKTLDRLAFLYEQLEISKKLKIAKNIISAENFETQNLKITNIKTNSPEYLRGYEAIQKEIDLIKSRKDNSLYIGEEFNKLLSERILINEDKKIARAENIFLISPLNSKNFKSTIVIPEATNFKYKLSKLSILLLAILVFTIFAIIYVLIENNLSIKKKKF